MTKKNTLFSLALTSLLAAFFFTPANVKAGPYENLRAQNPVANLNLSAVRAYNISALQAPAPLVDAEAAANPLPNFYQVTPQLYRSGQPTQAGVAKIAAAGIKTILKLNADSPAEQTWADGAGVALETILMSNKVSPTYEQVDQALAVINDASKQPVLVHCHLGHDRTGAVIGAYRVAVQGWPVAKAAAEAKQLGYSAPGFDDITAYLQGYLAHVRQRDARALSRGPAVPDWNYTPGNLCTPSDPNFKEYRYPAHVPYCNRNVTKDMKLQIAAHYGVPQAEWPNYEFDHLIPLGIGGDSSVDNLWPQPRGGSESDGKDKLENDLFKQLSAGTITQKEAVRQIYAWFNGYAARHPELPQPMQARLAALGN
jgi:protein tyrosine phosphatase (PTP) superfamily phosphohydrolase (DUF442 family)